jgi:hypothetical protein
MLCAHHPHVEAAWECRDCGRAWCDPCAKQVGEQHEGWLRASCACGCLLRSRRTRRLFTGREDLTELARRTFTSEGASAALACAIPSVIPSVGGWISSAAVAAAYFIIVDHVGRSRDGFPMLTEGVGDIDELRSAAIKGVAVAGVAFAPLAIYTSGSVLKPSDLLDSPISLLLILLPLLYMPAAILALVVTRSPLGALWPVAWFRIVSGAPSLYAELVGLFAVSAIAWWLCNVSIVAVFGTIPLIGTLLAGAISNMLLFTQACFVGEFLRRSGHTFATHQ